MPYQRLAQNGYVACTTQSELRHWQVDLAEFVCGSPNARASRSILGVRLNSDAAPVGSCFIPGATTPALLHALGPDHNVVEVKVHLGTDRTRTAAPAGGRINAVTSPSSLGQRSGITPVRSLRQQIRRSTVGTIDAIRHSCRLCRFGDTALLHLILPCLCLSS